MERVAGDVRPAAAIEVVPRQRAANMGKMDPQLMGAPGDSAGLTSVWAPQRRTTSYSVRLGLPPAHTQRWMMLPGARPMGASMTPFSAGGMPSTSARYHFWRSPPAAARQRRSLHRAQGPRCCSRCGSPGGTRPSRPAPPNSPSKRWPACRRHSSGWDAPPCRRACPAPRRAAFIAMRRGMSSAATVVGGSGGKAKCTVMPAATRSQVRRGLPPAKKPPARLTWRASPAETPILARKSRKRIRQRLRHREGEFLGRLPRHGPTPLLPCDVLLYFSTKTPAAQPPRAVHLLWFFPAKGKSAARRSPAGGAFCAFCKVSRRRPGPPWRRPP